MDATTTRASTVIRSMPTKEIRTQASITMPLSNTRSNTSIRLEPPDTRSTAIEGLLHQSQKLYFARLLRAACLPRLFAWPGGGAGNCTRLPEESGNEAVKLGSYFHQFSPICSALSTEQTSNRMRIVNNSTLAKEMRISPAITRPLSSTRSRMSRRLVVPETVGTLCMLSQETTGGRSPPLEWKLCATHERILTTSTETVNPSASHLSHSTQNDRSI